jgi:hypothetical protein
MRGWTVTNRKKKTNKDKHNSDLDMRRSEILRFRVLATWQDGPRNMTLRGGCSFFGLQAISMCVQVMVPYWQGANGFSVSLFPCLLSLADCVLSLDPSDEGYGWIARTARWEKSL